MSKMDRLDVLQLFIRVADTGSFSKAASAAGISQPTASKQVAALEARLGAQLLRRTSRGMSLTSAGQDYYESAVRLLDDVEVAESRIGHGQIAPSGLVRVAMSPGIGRLYVIPRLPEFFARYPDVSLALDISERHVSLIEDGIDVALRIGHLSDSSLMARRIGRVEYGSVASPAYLETFGTPMVPGDVEQHKCIAYMFRGAQRAWEFSTPSGPVTIAPKAQVSTNDAEHLRASVLAGLGIAHTLTWLFAADIAEGRVVKVLPGFVPPAFPVNAVWPGGRRVSGKVKVFIDFLAEVFASEPTLRIDGFSRD
ncbi:LysR family transcriptional regulator [Pseudomonas sp.]|jgi:LysR family transcriptional regulator for bpeEF and oprC|uniref:LysR family transcriptional regulator n=1 Tax=Pseudomonas sp. TaxID=306 RepID=UPI00260EE14E|nr:LysR family transcriptional regulator [Pseudomonas sp.]